MASEQSAATSAQTTWAVIDRFHVRGVDVFTVRGEKVSAKLAYVKG